MCPPSLRQEPASHIDRSLHHQRSEREVSKNTTSPDEGTRDQMALSVFRLCRRSLSNKIQPAISDRRIDGPAKPPTDTGHRSRVWLACLPYFPNGSTANRTGRQEQGWQQNNRMSHRFTGGWKAPLWQIGNAIQNVSANSDWISRSVS